MTEKLKLAQKRCVPCEGGMPPLSHEAIGVYMLELEGTGWKVVDDKKIRKEYTFKDFKESMVFINKVADLAEEEGHHPDIYIFYNKVTLELSTHAIGGLFDNDFILAAKINEFQH